MLSYRFQVRAEIVLDGRIFEHTPPARIRIAPSPPGGASPGGDVLFVTGPGLQPEDYRQLAALCGVLGRAAHFLDWEHFADAATGAPPAALWQGLRGNAAVVFCGAALPAPKGGAKEAFAAELVAHNGAGGSVVVDDKVPYPQSGGGRRGRAERMVLVGQLGALEGGLESKAERVAPGAVEGRMLTTLLRSLVATTPVEGKLALLGAATAARVVLQSLKPAQNFEQVVGSEGCLVEKERGLEGWRKRAGERWRDGGMEKGRKAESYRGG
jgi:hypothetical protein